VDIAQVVQCLPSIHKALDSTPSPRGKKVFLGGEQYWGLNSGPHLLRKWSNNNWAIAPVFCFSYFWDRVLHLRPGQPGWRSSYLCFPSSWDDKPTPPHPAGDWVGVSWTCCPGCPISNSLNSWDYWCDPSCLIFLFCFVFSVLLFVFLWGRVLLYSLGWPWTHNLPASASQVLILQMCTTVPSSLSLSGGIMYKFCHVL
jgi:hypothetical protein